MTHQHCLGIFVTSDRHPLYVVKLVRAAAAKGKTVRLFFSEKGLRLLPWPEVQALREIDGVSFFRRRDPETENAANPEPAREIPAVEASDFLHGCGRSVVF